MEVKNQHLLQPLIQSTTTNSYENDHKIPSSNSSIILRLFVVIFVGIVSLWANHEASKGFSITIVNEAIEGTFVNKRFDLFYVSNDEATRLVQRTSKFVENILYPIDDHQDFGQSGIKKQVKHVNLRLSSQNLTHPIIIKSSRDDNNDEFEFVIYISPSILEGPFFKRDMFLALQRGMACIWLWDGKGNAPSNIVNGMIEYITSLASLSGHVMSESESVKSDKSCWKSKDTKIIVKLLNYCEGKKEGFVRRLNKEMKNGWHEKIIDDVLGMPAWHLCETYYKRVSSISDK